MDAVEELGGAVAAIEAGLPEARDRASAYRVAQEIDAGERVVVGVNRFTLDDEEPYEPLRVDPAIEASRPSGWPTLRAERDASAVDRAGALREAAAGTDNVLYPMKEALRARATVGEVCDALREVWGVYRRPTRSEPPGVPRRPGYPSVRPWVIAVVGARAALTLIPLASKARAPTSWSSSGATCTPTPSWPGPRSAPPRWSPSGWTRPARPAACCRRHRPDLRHRPGEPRWSRCGPTSTRCPSTTPRTCRTGRAGVRGRPRLRPRRAHRVAARGRAGARVAARATRCRAGSGCSSSRPRRSCPAARWT